jgi:Haem-binding domain
MRKVFRYSVAAIALVLLAAQFIRPARTNPTSDPSRALAAFRPMPADVAGTFDRACRDCHSNETRWPWYSNVAPVSWFVIDHVNHGRSHFNYSDWSRYEPGEAARLLKKSCELAGEQAMPLYSYTLMHRTARLAPEEVAALCTWSRASARTVSEP